MAKFYKDVTPEKAAKTYYAVGDPKPQAAGHDTTEGETSPESATVSVQGAETHYYYPSSLVQPNSDVNTAGGSYFDRRTGQGHLFGLSYKPPQIVGAYSSRGGGHLVSTLLAHAHRMHPGITHDTNLSAYSYPIAHKAWERGLIPAAGAVNMPLNDSHPVKADITPTHAYSENIYDNDDVDPYYDEDYEDREPTIASVREAHEYAKNRRSVRRFSSPEEEQRDRERRADFISQRLSTGTVEQIPDSEIIISRSHLRDVLSDPHKARSTAVPSHEQLVLPGMGSKPEQLTLPGM